MKIDKTPGAGRTFPRRARSQVPGPRTGLPGRGPAVLAAIAGVAAFAFCLVTPRFRFAVTDAQFAVPVLVLPGNHDRRRLGILGPEDT